MEIFNLRKINQLAVRKQYQIAITNRFAALEKINYSSGINRTWGKNYRESEVASSGLYFLSIFFTLR